MRKAVSKTGTDIEGQEVVVIRCRPDQDRWRFSTDRMEETKIYVNNLSGNVQKSLLREVFSQVRVTKATIDKAVMADY